MNNFNTIALVKYKNYYNRQSKRCADNLRDIPATEIDPDEISLHDNMNFNPNDGVDTEIIINADEFLTFNPDYCLVCDYDMNVVSRWYVMEMTRTRGGQYKISLRRDVVAEELPTIEDDPILIEQGTVDINSPLIFTKEGNVYNQVKVDVVGDGEDIQLKDATEIGWLVGYLSKNIDYGEDDTKEIDIQLEIPSNPEDYNTIEDYPYFSYSDQAMIGTWGGTQNYGVVFTFESLPSTSIDPNIVVGEVRRQGGLQYPTREIVNNILKPRGIIDQNNVELELRGTNQLLYKKGAKSPKYITKTNDYMGTTGFGGHYEPTAKYEALTGKILNNFYSHITEWTTYVNRLKISAATKATLLAENGKILKDNTTGKFYKVTAYETQYQPNLVIEHNDINTLAESTIMNSISDFNNVGANPTCSFLRVFDAKRLIFKIEETYSGGNRVLYIKKQHRHLQDMPYDMFCIPYGELSLTHISDTPGITTGTTDKFSGEAAATAIAVQLSSVCYDVQLLPYCPFDLQDTVFNGSNYVVNQDYSPVYNYHYDEILEQKVCDSISSMVFWCTNSSKTNVRLGFDDQLLEYIQKETGSAIEKKIKSETTFMRLSCMNSSFEIDPQMNDGIGTFLADFTYKPHTPYIRVYPDFGGLYTRSFEKDTRGLIIRGDFSIPMISNQWAEYQLQNKNFQAIFDREITNAERKDELMYAQDLTGAITGAVGAGLQGGIVGESLGPIGAAVGGVISTGISAVAGAADVGINSELRQNEIQLSKDLHNYNLQNIQARPNTLTNIGAYDINTHIFPYIEIFTATDEEKDLLRKSLQYAGMKVNAISTIKLFSGGTYDSDTYIRGKIIRFNKLQEDYHYALTLNAEINKGIYI